MPLRKRPGTEHTPVVGSGRLHHATYICRHANYGTARDTPDDPIHHHRRYTPRKTTYNTIHHMPGLTLSGSHCRLFVGIKVLGSLLGHLFYRGLILFYLLISSAFLFFNPKIKYSI
jgi:hypothetical protein